MPCSQGQCIASVFRREPPFLATRRRGEGEMAAYVFLVGPWTKETGNKHDDDDDDDDDDGGDDDDDGRLSHNMGVL